MTDAGYVQVQDSPSLSSPKGSHLHSANNAALRPAAVRREERWCCFVIVIFIMRRAGDRVLLGWLGRAGAGDSFYYSSSQPPALLLSTPCPCHLVTGHLEPHYLGYSYTRCKHFSVSELPFPVWTLETMPMHRNVECECALESFDRKDGTSTFPIIWKLFRILNFDIIFNSSGIKQVGHIEFDKICKITSIPYIYPTPRAAVCTENFI